MKLNAVSVLLLTCASAAPVVYERGVSVSSGTTAGAGITSGRILGIGADATIGHSKRRGERSIAAGIDATVNRVLNAGVDATIGHNERRSEGGIAADIDASVNHILKAGVDATLGHNKKRGDAGVLGIGTTVDVTGGRRVVDADAIIEREKRGAADVGVGVDVGGSSRCGMKRRILHLGRC